MAVNPKYKRPETGAGELRIPVVFYLFAPDPGPEPGESRKRILHACMCEAYNPSIKDRTILDTTGTREAVTIKIRDPKEEYLPSNKHFAELDDRRFAGTVFSILDVRPDLKENRFITILLGVTS